jgi:predicted flap endonuclease-1-like 5' DNA nuclease
VEPLRLRAYSAVVAGLVAVAVVAVAGMILGESALDADPSAAEIAALVVPVALMAAVAGFVTGWLWRLWWPGTRTVAEIERANAELAEARATIADLEARAPEAPADDAPVDASADAEEHAEEHAADDEAAAAAPATPSGGSERPTSPAAEPTPETAPSPALSMDDVPSLDLDQDTAVARVTERFGGADPARHDDLKLIKGVGPVIERLLNDMNVRTFEQVASFTGEDVAIVSAALDGFPDRIVRDDWVGQARTLADRIRRT